MINASMYKVDIIKGDSCMCLPGKIDLPPSESESEEESE